MTMIAGSNRMRCTNAFCALITVPFMHGTTLR
jgi:hypothetical protein